MKLKNSKVMCRYVQRSAEPTVKLHTIEDSSKSSIHPRSTRLPRTTKKSTKKFCVHYISSTLIDRADLVQMLDCSSIDLSGNEIQNLERNIFQGHHQLATLLLDNNSLRRLPEGIFDDLGNLEKLSMRENWLEVLDDHLLMFNTKLKHFDCSNNNLIKISASMFDHNPALKVVSLNENFCIDSAFPPEPLHELKAQIEELCGEKNLHQLISNLVRISWNINEHKSSSETAIDTPTRTNPTKSSFNESSTLQPMVAESQSSVDRLIASLSWLIAPIIAILIVLLAIISFVIYKKYFVYQVRVRSSIL